VDADGGDPVTSQHYVIIGLPRSGKTTFLAVSRHLIDVGDRQHLNAIAEAWRRCEEVPRTSMAAEVSVHIHIHEPASGRKAVLSFPNLSGESFARQFATPSCRRNYVEGYEADGGILLFVKADRGHDGLTIMDLAPALEGAEDTDRAGVPRDWSPDVVPEQVQLVELLQFLQQRPFRRARRRYRPSAGWEIGCPRAITVARA
jgi:hypothetical protein